MRNLKLKAFFAENGIKFKDVAKELGITDMIENNDLVNRIGVTIK